MKEYIEREAAIKEIQFVRSLMATESEWLHGYASGLGAAADTLVYAPAADVVEVVKCKDCLHWDAKTKVCDEFTSERLQAGGRVAFLTEETDFCSYGERVEE